MDRYVISYRGWDGSEWSMTTSEWVAGLQAGGISGLAGNLVDSTADAVDGLGQFVDGQAFGPMTGSLRVAVRSDGDRGVDEVWARFRRAFSPRRDRAGVLRVSSPWLGTLSARVRLESQISNPEVAPAPGLGHIINVEVPLICDDGRWLTTPVRDTGTVKIINDGDGMIHPYLRWWGDGGRMVLPSGASFNLPAVSKPVAFWLSRRESLYVVDDDGNPDKATWKWVRGFPVEAVPEGTERTYRLPANAELFWSKGVLDPWQ